MNRGTSSQGYPAGSTIPLSREARAGRDRRGPQHLRRADPEGDPDQPARVRRHAGRARRRLNTAIRELEPLVAVAAPVMRNLVSPTTDLAGFVPALRPRRPRRRRSPRSRRRSSSTSTSPSPPSPTSPVPSSRTRSPSRRPPRRPLTASSPRSGRSSGTARPCSRTSARRRGAEEDAPILADAEAIGIKALRLAPSSTPRSTRRRSPCSTSPTTPARARASTT